LPPQPRLIGPGPAGLPPRLRLEARGGVPGAGCASAGQARLAGSLVAGQAGAAQKFGAGQGVPPVGDPASGPAAGPAPRAATPAQHPFAALPVAGNRAGGPGRRPASLGDVCGREAEVSERAQPSSLRLRPARCGRVELAARGGACGSGRPVSSTVDHLVRGAAAGTNLAATGPSLRIWKSCRCLGPRRGRTAAAGGGPRAVSEYASTPSPWASPWAHWAAGLAALRSAAWPPGPPPPWPGGRAAVGQLPGAAGRPPLVRAPGWSGPIEIRGAGPRSAGPTVYVAAKQLRAQLATWVAGASRELRARSFVDEPHPSLPDGRFPVVFFRHAVSPGGSGP